MDMSAHIGGLAVGLIGGYLFAKKPRAVWFFDVAMMALLLVGMRIVTEHYVQILH